MKQNGSVTTKQKGSFFSGLLVFFLVVVILGGVGFLGYNVMFKGNMNMAGMNMPTSSTDKNSSSDTASKDSSTTQSDSSSMSSMNMNNDSSSSNTNTSSSSSGNTESNYKLAQVNLALQDKESLDKTLAVLNDAFKEMTLDPYATTRQTDQNSNSTANNNQAKTPTTTTQGNSTVNIYTSSNNQTMESMGQSYDSNKMDQLHKGIYKLSIGMQLLDQLKNNVDVQVEQAGIDSTSKSQYYLNQYNITIQNKNKLAEALTYINQASDLVNVNPYVNASGVAYDKDRMTQLHESIYKLAEGVVDLNKLNDTLLKQAVQIGNLAQNAANESQVSNMNMSSSSSIFGNISFGTVVTFILIAFVVVFILALIGSVLSLFKSTEKKDNI